MATKKEKLKSIATKGQRAGELSQARNMSGGQIYREFGDREPSDVVAKRSVVYRGTAYQETGTNLATWIATLINTGDAQVGDLLRHQGKIYRITSPTSGTEQRF